MRNPTLLRLSLPAIALLSSTIAGCSGGGTTQDTAPTSPPITAENLKSKTAEINAGGAGMKPAGIPKK